MLRSLRSLIPTAALLASAACAGTPTTAEAQDSLRLLFLGNSLTYTWNIPDLVARMATAAGKPAPYFTIVAEADFGLEDLWNNGEARSALREGKYDIVIMQQGPSTLPESGANLTMWTLTFAREASKWGTRSALYAVAPPADGDLAAGIANYTAAADSARIGLYPAAQAWREAWRLDPALPLYGPDQFHPGRHGALLTAFVITAMIYHVPTDSLPNLFPEEITPAQLTTLRHAAATAVAAFGKVAR